MSNIYLLHAHSVVCNRAIFIADVHVDGTCGIITMETITYRISCHCGIFVTMVDCYLAHQPCAPSRVINDPIMKEKKTQDNQQVINALNLLVKSAKKLFIFLFHCVNEGFFHGFHFIFILFFGLDGTHGHHRSSQLLHHNRLQANVCQTEEYVD